MVFRAWLDIVSQGSFVSCLWNNAIFCLLCFIFSMTSSQSSSHLAPGACATVTHSLLLDPVVSDPSYLCGFQSITWDSSSLSHEVVLPFLPVLCLLGNPSTLIPLVIALGLIALYQVYADEFQIISSSEPELQTTHNVIYLLCSLLIVSNCWIINLTGAGAFVHFFH